MNYTSRHITLILIFIFSLLISSLRAREMRVEVDSIVEIEQRNDSTQYKKQAKCIPDFKEKSNVSVSLKSRWDRLMTWNFMALPMGSYAPETNLNLGATGVYYFKMPHTKRYSDLTFQFTYSLNNQWNIHLDNRLWFKGKDRPWFLDTRFHARRYPDLFYGIGSTPDDILFKPIDISDDYIHLNIRPQFYVADHLVLGAILNYRYSNTSTETPLDSLADYSPTTGFGEIHMLGLGASISYDSRSNTYYPLNGLFFKAMGIYYEPYLGSTYRMGYVDTDLRAYIPLYKQFLIAFQFKTQWAFGDEKPYQLLPTLGGQDLIRGVRGNMWKGDALMVLQAELRVPIWKFLKAAAFVSAGDVYDIDNWKWTLPKVGYGIGLRACIHDANMNIRFDVARQNYSDGWSFYFTVKEAF